MKKIKELQNRKKLNEGRNFGIGFSILNKIKSKFETYLPFTACRDYFNDFIFVEDRKKGIGTAHGYNHKVLNCFKRKRYFYLGVNTLHYNTSGTWESKEKALDILLVNYKNLERILNLFEEKIGITSKSKIITDEDVLIIKAPIYWTKSTPLISAYTLIIRCFFNADGTFVLNEENLLNHKPFIYGDRYFSSICCDFYKNIGLIDYTKIDYEKCKVDQKSWSTVHNFGIQGLINAIKKCEKDNLDV